MDYFPYDGLVAATQKVRKSGRCIYTCRKKNKSHPLAVDPCLLALVLWNGVWHVVSVFSGVVALYVVVAASDLVIFHHAD
jgi:hypothetical protein